MTRRTPSATPATTVGDSLVVVGLSASAGGLAAFEAFFTALTAQGEPAMAFVLVQHLAPDHKSALRELVQRHTPMPVVEAADGVRLAANHVYVIPPNHDDLAQRDASSAIEPPPPAAGR